MNDENLLDDVLLKKLERLELLTRNISISGDIGRFNNLKVLVKLLNYQCPHGI